MTSAFNTTTGKTVISIFSAVLLAAGLAAASTPAEAQRGSFELTIHSGPGFGPGFGPGRPAPRGPGFGPGGRRHGGPGFGPGGRRHGGPGFGHGGPHPGQYAHLPTRWHVRNHRQRPRWYHNNVARGHRLLPPRFRNMTHNFNGPGNRPGGRHGPAFTPAPRHSAPVVRPSRPHGPAPVVRPHRPRHPAPVHASTPAPRGGSRCQTINGGTILGAALGGLIGSQIGSGSGQLAATAAGTFLGAAIGGSAAC